MKLALVYPPTCDPTAPYLALPALAGALLVRPRVATSLALRAWSGWQMYRRARPVVERVLRQWR